MLLGLYWTVEISVEAPQNCFRSRNSLPNLCSIFSLTRLIFTASYRVAALNSSLWIWSLYNGICFGSDADSSGPPFKWTNERLPRGKKPPFPFSCHPSIHSSNKSPLLALSAHPLLSCPTLLPCLTFVSHPEKPSEEERLVLQLAWPSSNQSWSWFFGRVVVIVDLYTTIRFFLVVEGKVCIFTYLGSCLAFLSLWRRKNTYSTGQLQAMEYWARFPKK